MANNDRRKVYFAVMQLSPIEHEKYKDWLRKKGFTAKICPKCDELCFGFKRPIDCTSEDCPEKDSKDDNGQIKVISEVVTSEK